MSNGSKDYACQRKPYYYIGFSGIVKLFFLTIAAKDALYLVAPAADELPDEGGFGDVVRRDGQEVIEEL